MTAALAPVNARIGERVHLAVTLTIDQVKAALKGDWATQRQVLLAMQMMGLVILWTGIDGIYAVQLTHFGKEIGKAARTAVF